MNPALCSSGFLGILGLCRFCDFKDGESSPNLHRPKIPKNPDEQSAGFMHRPKIPKNPKIFRNYQARPWQSSKKSWDSWESWACAWILHFVHRDSWESWACAGFMKVLCEIMLFKKMYFPCGFWWWTSEFVQRVFIFWSNFWKWGTGFWFCIIGCFFKTGDCNRNYFTYSVFKKHWYLQWFLHGHNLQDEDEDTYVILPLLQVGPGRGGDIYIYIHINIHVSYIIYIHILYLLRYIFLSWVTNNQFRTKVDFLKVK